MSIKRTPAAAAVCAILWPLVSGAAPAELEATVVVTATRLPTRANELLNDVTLITRSEIEASGAASLPELLSSQPGVQLVTNGGVGKTANLYLRGAESRHTVVLIDGMRINSATGGDTAIQHIPLAQIERIEIVRGPVSSLYGSEAIGGVVQVFTRRDGPGASLRASAGSRNTSDLSVGISGASGVMNYSLALGRYETDGTSALINPANSKYNRDTDGYRQENLSGRIEVDLAPGHSLAANVFHSDGVSRYDNGAASYDHRLLHTLQGMGIESRNRLAGHWTSTLKLSSGIDDSTNHSSATAKSVFKTEQTQAIWQNDFRTGFGDWLVGVERLDQRVVSSTVYAKTARSLDSLLLGYQGRFNAHRLQASVRHDDSSQFGARSTGMAYYGYQITADWRGSIGTGTSFSAPTFNQLYFPGFGNTNLQPERGKNREAALIWESGNDRASITWFDNRVSDLIQSVLVVAPATFAAQNVQRAKLSGWTFTGQTRLAGWNARASLDLLDARDEDSGKRLPRRARETLSLGASRDIGAWSIRGDTVMAGDRYDLANERVHLSGYAVVNVGIDYRYAPGTIVFARAENLFDKRYELAADFATARAGVFVGVRHELR